MTISLCSGVFSETTVPELDIMGAKLIVEGNFEEAAQVYDELLAVDPQYVDGWIGKGMALFFSGSYSESIKFFDEALKLDPENLNALDFQKQALDLMNTENIVQQSESEDGWNETDESLSADGNYAEALEVLDQTLSSNPDDAVSWFMRGNALLGLERYEEALESFTQAVTLDPSFVNAWINKGSVLNQLKEYSQAVLAFEQAILLDPGAYVAWENKGNALYNSGELELAIAAYDEALKIDPSNSRASSYRQAAISKVNE
jgi:tetratricopeptide (TPR) repeat protein